MVNRAPGRPHETPARYAIVSSHDRTTLRSRSRLVGHDPVGCLLVPVRGAGGRLRVWPPRRNLRRSLQGRRDPPAGRGRQGRSRLIKKRAIPKKKSTKKPAPKKPTVQTKSVGKKTIGAKTVSGPRRR